jgi:hypothetical protein
MGIQWSSASAVYRLLGSLDAVRREVLYNILTECAISMKLIWLKTVSE